MGCSHVWLGVLGGFYYPSLCNISIREREIGVQTEKNVNFGHAHGILGKTSH